MMCITTLSLRRLAEAINNGVFSSDLTGPLKSNREKTQKAMINIR